MSLALVLLMQAATPLCAGAESTGEERVCAIQVARSADVAMAQQLATVRAIYAARDSAPPEPGQAPSDHVALLDQAQTAWLAYRAAHCSLDARAFWGGSQQGITQQLCRARLTIDRTAALRALIEEPEE